MGLYAVLASADASENHSLAEACKRVPGGIVCLLSALRFHGLTTQNPWEVWIAVTPASRKPKVDHPPLRIVRFSGMALTEGIECHRVEGVDVRIYSAAKTVADCFKYRNKIGVDVARFRPFGTLGKNAQSPRSKSRTLPMFAGSRM